MGSVIRREQVILIPNKYWESSHNNIKWLYKESNAENIKRNK